MEWKRHSRCAPCPPAGHGGAGSRTRVDGRAMVAPNILPVGIGGNGRNVGSVGRNLGVTGEGSGHRPGCGLGGGVSAWLRWCVQPIVDA